MADQKQQIADAAWQILQRDGVDAITFRNVATEANYSRGAVAHHFGTREGLIDHLHVAAVEFWAAMINTGDIAHPLNERLRDQNDDRLLRVAMEGLRTSAPGSWELLRTRRCPEFDEKQAPNAWAVCLHLFRGEVWPKLGPVIDVLLVAGIALHEMIVHAPPAEQERILSKAIAPEFMALIWGDVETVDPSSTNVDSE